MLEPSGLGKLGVLQPMRYGRVSNAKSLQGVSKVYYDAVAFSVQSEACDSVTHIIQDGKESQWWYLTQ